jgi:hypothetical protein
VLSLEFDEPRHRRGHAEFFGIRSVNAGHERLDESLEDFATQPATYERGDTFIGHDITLSECDWPSEDQWLGQQPQLAGNAQQRRSQDRQELSRRHEEETFRYRQQLPVAHDKRAASRFMGWNELLFHPKTLAKFKRSRRRGEKVVGGAFDEKAIVLDSFKHTAEPMRPLEERKFCAREQFAEPIRRGEAGDAATDNGDARRRSKGEFGRRKGEGRH